MHISYSRLISMATVMMMAMAMHISLLILKTPVNFIGTTVGGGDVITSTSQIFHAIKAVASIGFLSSGCDGFSPQCVLTTLELQTAHFFASFCHTCPSAEVLRGWVQGTPGSHGVHGVLFVQLPGLFIGSMVGTPQLPWCTLNQRGLNIMI